MRLRFPAHFIAFSQSSPSLMSDFRLNGFVLQLRYLRDSSCVSSGGIRTQIAYLLCSYILSTYMLRATRELSYFRSFNLRDASISRIQCRKCIQDALCQLLYIKYHAFRRRLYEQNCAQSFGQRAYEKLTKSLRTYLRVNPREHMQATLA